MNHEKQQDERHGAHWFDLRAQYHGALRLLASSDTHLQVCDRRCGSRRRLHLPQYVTHVVACRSAADRKTIGDLAIG
jgi:hypothetical protein